MVCPANWLDSVFSSTAVLPMSLLLGSGLLFDPGTPTDIDPASPSATESVEEEQPGPQEEVPAAQEEVALQPASTEVSLSGAPGYQGPLPETTGGVAPRVTGYFSLRSQSRWAVDHGDEDHDLYGVAGVDYFTGGENSWGLHLMVRGSWGLNEQDPDSVFFGVQDTYTNQLEGRIYHAYADAPTGDSLGLLRFGRMLIYETPVTVYVDGAQVETTPNGPTEFVMGAYGGGSVHQFDDWPSDELLGGVYTRFRPWVDGLLRIDWLHLDDENVRFADGQNDLIAADLLHLIGDGLRLNGNFSLLEGRANDLQFDGLWMSGEGDMSLRFSYYELLEAQRDLANELNPFFNIVNTYYPFNQTQFVVTKSFDEVLELYGGLDMRRVDEEGDIGRYNRDFDRYYLTAALPSLLPLETTVSLTGEIWDSPDTEMESWGLDLTSRMTEDTKLSLGSYYSLYKYYFDISDEREDVRTYYGELRNSVSDSMNVMARYEYEDQELDSFHSLRLGVTWRF